MSSRQDHSILLGTNASTFAFRAGQLFEQLLLNRAEEIARDAQEPVVTIEMVESCIDGILLEEVRKQLDEPAESESRRVA